MKQFFSIIAISLFSLACSQKTPEISKTEFSKEALAQKLEDENGKSVSIQKILNKHKGKIVVIDFWAGWCRDCLKAMPKAKELEDRNTDIDFVFLSLERSKESFDKSLEKYNMKGKENYWFSTGWKNNFNNYSSIAINKLHIFSTVFN